MPLVTEERYWALFYMPLVTEERYWALFYMPLYTFTRIHNFLNVLVHIANKMEFTKKTYIFSRIYNLQMAGNVHVTDHIYCITPEERHCSQTIHFTSAMGSVNWCCKLGFKLQKQKQVYLPSHEQRLLRWVATTALCTSRRSEAN
jgi:hypothetical protein